MMPTNQFSPGAPVSAPQRAYLTVEQQPADAQETERLERLKKHIDHYSETSDLRHFADQARRLMGEGYTVGSGSAHVWLKRTDQTERLAIIADAHTTRYRPWDEPPANPLPAI